MARIGLTQLPRKAQQHVKDNYGLLVEAPPYRRGFDGAVSNKFPAEFLNGRWTVDEGDLDRIAIALGMIDGSRVSATADARSVAELVAT